MTGRERKRKSVFMFKQDHNKEKKRRKTFRTIDLVFTLLQTFGGKKGGGKERVKTGCNRSFKEERESRSQQLLIRSSKTREGEGDINLI